MAAASYAEDSEKNSPPPELTLAIQAERWGVLPEAGGLRDQRLGEIKRMIVALNAYKIVKSYKNASSKADWIKNNPERWKLYTKIKGMRDGNA